VNRRVVYEDVMSGTTLVTGIVTVLWRDEEGYHVRDAEPVEAARLICAEAVWAASGPTDKPREWHAFSPTLPTSAVPQPPATAQPSLRDEPAVTGLPAAAGQHPGTGQPPATGELPVADQPTSERPVTGWSR
jgi:hypothetical protein